MNHYRTFLTSLTRAMCRFDALRQWGLLLCLFALLPSISPAQNDYQTYTPAPKTLKDYRSLQANQPNTSATGDSHFPSATTPIGSMQLDEYLIGPFDLLEITVFQVPEMNRAVRVNSQGMISLPLIGGLRAGGLTATELESVISVKLSENLLQDPQVSIFIKEFVSQRVTIEGFVPKPGIYPLSGKTTLLQVIALAGGLDVVADASTVKIFRTPPNGEREIFTFDISNIRSGESTDPTIKGNDIIIVDKSDGAYALKRVLDTVRGFIGFGSIPLAR